MRGLMAVARGVRQVPKGSFAERVLVNDGKALPYDNASMVLLDPHRQAQLKSLSPRAKRGV